MKELFECLKNCITLILNIQELQKKKSRTPFDRSNLDFKKEVLPIYLERLEKVIKEFKNKKED